MTTTPPPFHTEAFTAGEQATLAPYFTNLDLPVFAVRNLPEVVKGALFARYSRSDKSIRRLFLDEFADQPDIAIATIAAQPAGSGDSDLVGLERAEKLYDRVFTQYGDDSVAQLGAAHVAGTGIEHPHQGPRVGSVGVLPRAEHQVHLL